MILLKRFFKTIILGFIIFISLVITLINFKLYPADKADSKKDIGLHLNFLESELKHNNLGNKMQEIFPEGFVFVNALYGLAWCEYGMADSNPSVRKKALNEALFSYDQISSEKAKSIFETGLIPEHGIFYTGWNNYLLSKILLLDSGFANSTEYKNIFQKQCNSISVAFMDSKTPFLESYSSQCWPADNCVALASLSNHDKIFTPKYAAMLADWINRVRQKLDSRTRLIPHKVNSTTGEKIEGARGCSISLILRLLSEIDLPFAKEQFVHYRENFVTTTFGLPSIREYPVGLDGYGDVDSGPVIFGVGFAGTLVSIGTFSALGDNLSAEHQYETIHAFGFSCKNADSKKYLFGQLPIADAFISWGRSTCLNHNERINSTSTFWRLKFHLISILIIAILSLPFYLHKIILVFRNRQ
jgi:hypothetical protein